MSEPKVDNGAAAEVDMDVHLDAAIRGLDRFRQAEAPVHTLDEAASAAGATPAELPHAQHDALASDHDLDEDLFDAGVIPAAAAAPEVDADAIGPRELLASDEPLDLRLVENAHAEPAYAEPAYAEPAYAEADHAAEAAPQPFVLPYAPPPEAENVVEPPQFAEAAPVEPEPVAEPEPIAEPEPVALAMSDPQSSGETSPAADAPAAEDASASAAPAAESDLSPLPRRMFGLRRALEAHRQGVSLSEIPEFPQPVAAAETASSMSAPPEPVPASLPVVVAAPAAAAAASTEPEEKPARRSWFGGRKKASDLVQVPVTETPVAPKPAAPKPEEPVALKLAAVAPIVPVAAAVAAAAATAAPPVEPPTPEPAPTAKAERRGWFGFRKKAEPEPEAPPPPEPLVDLAPVREAMQAAAVRRAQELQAAATAASGESDSTTTAAMPQSSGSRIGVLLVNLGTPEAPTARAVRRYLREFLADKRVIEKDSFGWQLVLKGIILPFRPRIKARAYRLIWNKANQESPLKTITRAQAVKLGEALTGLDSNAVVDWAMRYGEPAIEQRLRALMAQGCERILVVPLYPQYSSATTASVCDEVFRVLSRIRNQPTVRMAPPYHAEPVYIEALASSIKAELATLSFVPEAIIASYHGMPLEYVQQGDPYYNHCVATTKLLRERLGMNDQNLIMTFQSRFGRTEWLQPYTDQTLRKLVKDGVKNVAVVTPGFSADCLETLEEIAVENARAFKKKGGKNFAFIPCLNDSERGMLVIWDIATRELKGWV
jgi:ferrochelatase